MQDFLAFINQVLWGAILLYLVPATGVWFTLRCSFVQFRYFVPAVKSLKITFRTANKNITPFQSICTSMAARVGSGNLAGVVIALAGGGRGLCSGCGLQP
ncbi:alanine:cation symporter family protein [Mangrovibacter sp. SLW1]